MRILGVELSRKTPAADAGKRALVLLDDSGRVSHVEPVGSLAEAATAVGKLVGDEPFLLGVDIPVVVPAKLARARAVEGLVRRRFGFRLPPGGRAALTAEPMGVAGEALLAGLGAAGLPCLPFPDRDRRKNGLAETCPELTLKILLWQTSPIAGATERAERDELFRAYAAPPYHAAKLPARTGWAERAVALEIVLRALGDPPGFDLAPAREALAAYASERDTGWAAALFDAALIAGTARRYLETPENSLFLGDQDAGYVIVPADSFVRRQALTDAKQPTRSALFPHASLRERLGRSARLRSVDLLNMPGRPERVEATFSGSDGPSYEFDNVDEMLWWKHCRHVTGPHLPTEGLCEMAVVLDSDGAAASPLRLVRSRHRTLSFRFDPPGTWRRHLPTRDGKTYPFQVVRAVYDTLPPQD